MSLKEENSQGGPGESGQHSELQDQGTKNRGRRLSVFLCSTFIVVVVVAWLALGSGRHNPSGDTASVVRPRATLFAPGATDSTKEATAGASIHYPEPSHDFGTVAQGSKVSHTFVVQNVGQAPLKLIRAKGS